MPGKEPLSDKTRAEAAAAGQASTSQNVAVNLGGCEWRNIANGNGKGSWRLRRLQLIEVESALANIPALTQDRGEKGVWAYVAAVGKKPGQNPFMKDITLSQGEPMSERPAEETAETPPSPTRAFRRRCLQQGKPVGPGSKAHGASHPEKRRIITP